MITSKYLLQNVENYGNKPAISIKNQLNQWQTQSWKEFYSSVLDISKSLIVCNANINDKIRQTLLLYNNI